MNSTVTEIANGKHPLPSKLFENQNDSLRLLDRTGSLDGYGAFQYNGKSLDYRYFLKVSYDKQLARYRLESYDVSRFTWFGGAEIPNDFPSPELVYVSFQEVTGIFGSMVCVSCFYLILFIYFLWKKKHGKPFRLILLFALLFNLGEVVLGAIKPTFSICFTLGHFSILSTTLYLSAFMYDVYLFYLGLCRI